MEVSFCARRSALTACLVAVACVLVLSCSRQISGDAQPPPAPQPWSGPLEGVSVVWSAEPGIDLAAGPAVPVRAYVESYRLVSDLATIRVAYPGFTQAVADTEQPGNPWPYTEHIRRYPLVGTERIHLLRVDANGRDVAAYVCFYSGFTSTNDLGNGKFGYPPSNLASDGVDVMRLSMTAPEAPSTLPPQRGPALAPADDVFEGWRIEDRRVPASSDLSTWPTVGQDLALCRDRAPEPLERREFLRQGEHPRSDFPTLPAYPGWPAAAPS